MASLNDYWTAWQITKQEKLENLNSKQIIKVKENMMVTDGKSYNLVYTFEAIYI